MRGFCGAGIGRENCANFVPFPLVPALRPTIFACCPPRSSPETKWSGFMRAEIVSHLWQNRQARSECRATGLRRTRGEQICVCGCYHEDCRNHSATHGRAIASTSRSGTGTLLDEKNPRISARKIATHQRLHFANPLRRWRGGEWHPVAEKHWSCVPGGGSFQRRNAAVCSTRTFPVMVNASKSAAVIPSASFRAAPAATHLGRLRESV